MIAISKRFLIIVCAAIVPDIYATYWEDQFSDVVYTTPTRAITTLQHHSQQNYFISSDFVKQIMHPSNAHFFQTLDEASSLIEVGCGSGEMLQFIGKLFPEIRMVGVDLSYNGIAYANKHNRSKRISYKQFNALDNSLRSAFGKFDIAICSNTLEHFRHPFILLDNILEACEVCIILVPYKQPVTDGYEMEGGPGHVYSFDEHAFSEYKVLSWFVFQTPGWAWSSKGEQPLQLAIMVAKNNV